MIVSIHGKRKDVQESNQEEGAVCTKRNVKVPVNSAINQVKNQNPKDVRMIYIFL